MKVPVAAAKKDQHIGWLESNHTGFFLHVVWPPSLAKQDFIAATILVMSDILTISEREISIPVQLCVTCLSDQLFRCGSEDDYLPFLKENAKDLQPLEGTHRKKIKSAWILRPVADTQTFYWFMAALVQELHQNKSLSRWIRDSNAQP